MMQDIVKYIVATLIAIGGISCTVSLFKYRQIVKKSAKLPGKLPVFVGAMKYISQVMLIFFVVGYIVGFVDVITGAADKINIFIGVVFFVAGVFTILLMQYLSHLVDSLSNYNDNLKNDVEAQTKELRHRDALLQIANMTASTLLASDTEDFDSDLHNSMGMLAKSVGVDRVFIWKNIKEDKEFFVSQIYGWPNGVNDNMNLRTYEEIAPGWDKILRQKKCINGPVTNFPEKDQVRFNDQSIVSIMVVPVFLKKTFWGFVSFEDCRSERDFSEAEEDIFRSVGLSYATGILRNEMTLSLIAAKEAADFSARAKSDFLSNMSHEIRTPINAITGMSAIASRTDDKERVRDCMAKIDVASHQLLGLINDILDMSKIEAGKMVLSSETFDVHATLQNVKSIIDVRASEKGLALNLDIADDVPNIYIGDEMRLTQILLNLLSNAVKFTPKGGKIDVDCRVRSIQEETCTLEFRITDTGIGISDEQKVRLFRAFEQAQNSTAKRYGGTGLGLAISKRIANMMNGDIEIESEVGKGSCFTVFLNMCLGSEHIVGDEDENDEVLERMYDGYTILLAEDIEINREIVITLLDEKNAKVVTAVDGVEVVNIFAEDPEKYDLILMDIQMPNMDGLTATKKIRALDNSKSKSIPILAMTANAFDEDVKQCLDAGMDGHIVKPIDIKQFFIELSRLLPQN